MVCCVMFTALLSLCLRSAAEGNVCRGRELRVEERAGKSFTAEVTILELPVRKWLFHGERENGHGCGNVAIWTWK